MHYRMSRFYTLWRWMTPGRIHFIQRLLIAAAGLLLIAASWQLAAQHRTGELVALWAALLLVAATIAWAAWLPEAVLPAAHRHARPMRHPTS